MNYYNHSEMRTLIIIVYIYIIPVALFALAESAGPKKLRGRLRRYHRRVLTVFTAVSLIFVVWALVIILSTGR